MPAPEGMTVADTLNVFITQVNMAFPEAEMERQVTVDDVYLMARILYILVEAIEKHTRLEEGNK